MLAIILVILATTVAAVQFSNEGMLCLVNMQRQKNGLPPLGLDPRLTSAAAAHSEDQARTGEMSHNGSDGSNPGTRVRAAGFNWKFVGENVAFGFDSMEAVMNSWMNSPGHRANILGKQYTMFGSGVASKGQTAYWTQDFGNDGSMAKQIPPCGGSEAGGPGAGSYGDTMNNGHQNGNDESSNYDSMFSVNDANLLQMNSDDSSDQTGGDASQDGSDDTSDQTGGDDSQDGNNDTSDQSGGDFNQAGNDDTSGQSGGDFSQDSNSENFNQNDGNFGESNQGGNFGGFNQGGNFGRSNQGGNFGGFNQGGNFGRSNQGGNFGGFNHGGNFGGSNQGGMHGGFGSNRGHQGGSQNNFFSMQSNNYKSSSQGGDGSFGGRNGNRGNGQSGFGGQQHGRH